MLSLNKLKLHLKQSKFMKKKLIRGISLDREKVRKIWMTMRLIVILFFVSLIHVSASVYSQKTKLNIRVENASLQQVFKVLQEQSEFDFFYKNEQIPTEARVSIQYQNESIEVILDKILTGTGLTYHVLDKDIVISSKGGAKSEIVSQQQKSVSGKVSDSTGGGLPGVSVVVKGTTTGVITDMDGKYTLARVPENAILQFSFVGMKRQEISIEGKTTINVTLAEDAIGIEEVVAIGYGTRAKKDLTGAVSQISSIEITKQVTMSPQLSMQGKMAGVYVSNPGSDPNTRPSIRIRGVSTMGFNDPLYVVDGIPLTEGGSASSDARAQDLRGTVNVLNMINPNDIESISVLKDASATAIYGVRASNGVILITTKRGSEGKVKVNLTANYGIQNINNRYDVANIADYVAWTNEAIANNTALSPNADYKKFFDATNANYLGNSPDYTNDWLNKTLVKNAPVQDYNLSVTGGNKVSNYAVGAGYASQEDAMYKSNLNRYSFFLNSDHKLNKYFKVGESFRYIYSKAKDIGGPDLTTALSAPWQPLYDETQPNGIALPGRTIDGKFLSNGYGGGTRSNFLSNQFNNFSERNLIRNMGSFYAEFSPLEGLRFKGTFSFDTYSNTREQYQTDERGLYENTRGLRYTTGTFYGRRVNENINIVKEFLIGYTKSFGKHNVDLVLNAMDQKVQWNNSQESINANSAITSWDQRRIDEGWAAIDKGLLYERILSGLQGYMGRMSYNYDHKYYLDATIRRDGTSKFGPGYKWGTFPSFGAVWRISSEGFMKDISWLNDLKIRGGWGKTGNQETRDFAFLSLVNYNPKYALGAGAPGDGVINAAAVLGDFPVENMSWETVTSSSFAVDAILLDSKLSFTGEYYNRLTDGILQTISIPLVVGALNAPVVNLAQVENKGFEFQVGYTNKVGKLGYNASLNLTTVKNNVKTLYRGLPSTSGNSRTEQGYSMGFIYGYKTDGIFQTIEDVSAWKATTTDAGKDAFKSMGDVRFVDLYGAPIAGDPAGALKHYAPDGKIDGNDQTYLGKTIPGYYYGINLGFDYNNWDLSFNFRGVGDVQRINTDGKLSIGAGGGNFLAAYRDRWTTTNASNTIPRAANGDPAGNNRISDRMIEDAGFLRFQNLQLGYNFKGSILQKVGFSSLRCFVSGSNLFVITPYTGLDPENDTTPTTFSIGANLNF
jgi:TonB-linked SusC/RagA family outer membrane protein